VRARAASETQALREAGADEVVLEPVEAAVRLSALLGDGAQLSEQQLRSLPALAAGGTLGDPSGRQAERPAGAPPVPQAQLDALAAESGLSVAQVVALWDVFATLDVDDDGEVQLAEVRNVLMRASVTPIDDSALQAWMADADEDGGGALDFGEFVRVSSKGNVTF